MITYAPFYQTLFKRGHTEYELIYHHGISSHTLHRMRKGKPITTTTLDTLCFVLNCNVSDIIAYIPDDSEKLEGFTKKKKPGDQSND